jgi:hypothetical protein
MTLTMADAVDVSWLKPGYNAYLGYADGEFHTAAALAAKFPASPRIILTVTGTPPGCDGADVESGDLRPGDGCLWAEEKLRVAPGSRPVLYASVSTMPLVLRSMSDLDINRPRVRLLSAHYGAGEHICGPATCKLIGTPMDGTQWLRGGNGQPDISVLNDDFFGTPTETETLVQELGTVKQGQNGQAVRTVQALCGARGAVNLHVDGVFGPQTLSAVRAIQVTGKVAVDGVVGPQTWPVLLGVA